MRRFVLLVLALAVVPPAAAADLSIVPRDFSPKQERLRIKTSLPKPRARGVQLTRRDGACRLDRRAGAPTLPRLPLERPLRGARSATATTASASSMVHACSRPHRSGSTSTAAQITNIDARNRSRLPFRGDDERYTTISPTGTSCASRPSLVHAQRPAQVHFEVTRTISAPNDDLRVLGDLSLEERLHVASALVDGRRARSLIPMTTVDKAGNGARTAPTTPARAGSWLGRRPGARRRRRLHRRELRRIEHCAARDRDRRDRTDAAGLPHRGEDTRTHSDTIMHGVPVNQSVTIPRSPPSPSDARLGGRAVGERRLLRQADREDGRVGYAPLVVARRRSASAAASRW